MSVEITHSIVGNEFVRPQSQSLLTSKHRRSSVCMSPNSNRKIASSMPTLAYFTFVSSEKTRNANIPTLEAAHLSE